MITNATITSIASASGNARGEVAYGTPTVLNVRVFMDQVRSQDIRQLGALLDDGTSAKMFVPQSALASKPLKEQKVTIAIDGDDSIDYRIVYVDASIKSGGLGHWAVYLFEL